jgi:outer membrane protein TolC
MYRFIRLPLLAFSLISISSVIRAQAPTDESLPLPENYFPGLAKLLDAALTQSPRMIARNTDLVIAEADRISTRSAQLPTFGGYGSWYPWTRDKRGDLVTANTSTGHKLGYNVALNQPLWHWGALRDNTRVAELRQKMSQGQYAEGYRVLVQEIRGQYLLLIIKKAGLARTKFNQKIADDALALARSKQEKHVIAEADLFGPTIAAEQARLGTDRIQEDFEAARAALARLTGQPPLTDDQIPDEIPPITPAASSVDAIAQKFTARGEISSYAIQTTKRQIEVENLSYKITDKRLWPKFNAVAGVSQDEQIYAAFGLKYNVLSYYTGLTASWTLFDGFATRGAKAASLARRRQLERNLADQKADFVQSIRSQQRQIEFSARNLAIVEKLLESSKSGYEIAQEDLKRGLLSDATLDNNRLSYMDTQINTYLARDEYIMKVADFLSTTQQDPALAKLPAEVR